MLSFLIMLLVDIGRRLWNTANALPILVCTSISALSSLEINITSEVKEVLGELQVLLTYHKLSVRSITK